MADLVVVAQPVQRDETGPAARFASQLLVGSGCPLVFVPEAAVAGRCGTRVLIAWADTRVSARALRDALPILRRAEAVEVLRFGAGRDDGGEPLDVVAGYLARHKVQARCSVRAVREIPFAERMLVPNVVDPSIAELLLSHAATSNTPRKAASALTSNACRRRARHVPSPTASRARRPLRTGREVGQRDDSAHGFASSSGFTTQPRGQTAIMGRAVRARIDDRHASRP